MSLYTAQTATSWAYSVDSPLIAGVCGYGQLMDEWALREDFRQIFFQVAIKVIYSKRLQWHAAPKIWEYATHS